MKDVLSSHHHSHHPDDKADNSQAYKFTHECQVVTDVEADLQIYFSSCKKNPDHANLVPIKNFTLEHLPEGHRDNDLLELIRAAAELTVRISVTDVSSKRPDIWPKSEFPYPFYKTNVQSQERTGSGQMVVYKYTNGYSYEYVTGSEYTRPYTTCQCKKCELSGKASNVWWEIYVHTAAHVVFDDFEAAHTSCRLFFDDNNCHKDVLKDFTMHFVKLEFDKSMLKYVTCDSVLGTRLVNTLERFNALWEAVDSKYTSRPDNKLNFIVSHPHGCPKHVGISEHLDIATFGEHNAEFDIAKLVYSTSTCPGSSGARVYCVGFGSTHVHTGMVDSERNCSSIDLYMKQ